MHKYYVLGHPQVRAALNTDMLPARLRTNEQPLFICILNISFLPAKCHSHSPSSFAAEYLADMNPLVGETVYLDKAHFQMKYLC